MQNLIKNQKGGIIIMFAIVLPVLIIGVMASIDITKVVNTQSKFEHTLDNALLSAVAKSISVDPTETANHFFHLNMPNTDDFELVSLEITHDPGTLIWTATATGNVDTFLSGTGLSAVIGTHEVEHLAAVQWDVSGMTEVAVTLDTSASMCMTTNVIELEEGVYRTEYRPDPDCYKLESLKLAITNIIDKGVAPIEGYEGVAYKVGLIPFNHKVKFAENRPLVPEVLTHTEATHPRATNGGSYYTDFTDAEPLSPIKALTEIDSDTAKLELLNHIANIEQSPEGMGWTRSNIATLTAALMLDPDYQNYFRGSAPAPFDDENVEKIAILMTDGANIGCCYAVHPEGNYENQYLYLYEADNAHLVGMERSPEMEQWKADYRIPDVGICDQMKDRGIKIYSIVFDVDDNHVGGQEIKEAYEYCASNPQYYFDVMTREDLVAAYETVAQSLIRLRLIK